MLSLIAYLKEDIQNNLPDISHFIHDGGLPLGSNDGGIFHDPYTHQKHYIKLYKNPDQARSEVAAAQIYEKLGAKTLKPQLGMYKGKLGVVTKWRDDLKPVSRTDYTKLSEKQKHDLANHFHAAVLTKNWDTVGLVFDNLAQDKAGNLHTLDTGGSFNFRAQGGHKDYHSDIAEFESLHNHNINPAAAHAFKHLQDRHYKSSINKLKEVDKADYNQIINSTNLPKEHADILKTRHEKLLETINN